MCSANKLLSSFYWSAGCFSGTSLYRLVPDHSLQSLKKMSYRSSYVNHLIQRLKEKVKGVYANIVS